MCEIVKGTGDSTCVQTEQKRSGHIGMRSSEELVDRSLGRSLGAKDLCDSKLKVLVRDVLSTFSQSVHTSFCADTSHFGTGTLTHLLGKRTKVDTSLQ